LLYFAGRGVQGLPQRLARKRRLGIFLDRVGISHDLALVAADETLLPVAKLQVNFQSENTGRTLYNGSQYNEKSWGFLNRFLGAYQNFM